MIFTGRDPFPLSRYQQQAAHAMQQQGSGYTAGMLMAPGIPLPLPQIQPIAHGSCAPTPEVWTGWVNHRTVGQPSAYPYGCGSDMSNSAAAISGYPSYQVQPDGCAYYSWSYGQKYPSTGCWNGNYCAPKGVCYQEGVAWLLVGRIKKRVLTCKQ